METIKILIFCVIFVIGIVIGVILNNYIEYGFEKPFLSTFGLYNSGFSSEFTPQDYIKENQIEIYSDRIIIKIQNASLSKYAPTGSMIPILDEKANGIRIIPKSENDIKVGDIITFKKEDGLIVHRVIEKGIDKEGIYFITKGDNNTLDDGKIRFSEIKYITVAILW